MTARKSKKRDSLFIEVLAQNAVKVDPYESTDPILEQIIECVLDQDESDLNVVKEVKNQLLVDFVDWNEVRIVTKERLSPSLKKLTHNDYKVKVLQAVLNKIFSRTGSLECQFLLDFEKNDLEDYLTGIMELTEYSRKRLILRVFKKHVLPFTSDHEVIFETFGSQFVIGDTSMIELFEPYDEVQLQGILELLNTIIGENKGGDEFSSATLTKFIKKADAAK